MSEEPVRLAKDGEDKVKAWVKAQRVTKNLTVDLRHAERDERDAMHELANWLLPKTRKVGEKFCVWYLDALLEVTVGPGEFHEVKVRSFGSEWARFVS